ncbi:2OG-Fe(II) oxygenase [Sulfurimonas crateris]|uniref:2OG-Fe(II) oxygenase n=1 Tax=Sulfurimonas crateris TaxID=2574727 RepID=A0A4U2Z6G6_9BACT|nr:2OG-Fe(II) oxygenase [Sulfurimonas crateris]TKI69082.1 2OG-Fe(II) oxygenase [Sulfurimonas crateris]
MHQISNHIFCDDFIAELKLEMRLLANPYYDYPYLIIKNFFSKAICHEISEYAYNTSEGEKAKVKTRVLGSVVDPSVDESIRKTLIHKLSELHQGLYEENFKIYQPQIERFFSVALTTSTTLQALEYTKGSFYIKHSDDSNELVDAHGRTVGFVQVAPQRKITTVLFTTPHKNHSREEYSFSGGELVFNYLFDAEGKQIKLYPEAGDMIVFPSNPIYSHEVLPIKDGYRLTLVQWHNAIVN